MSEPGARGRFIKICGLTTLEDAEAVVEAGADAMGLIFAPSTRRVDVEIAAQISEALRGRIVRVGVFRAMDDDEILAVLERVELDAVQLHDPLSERLVSELRVRHLWVIKALVIGSPEFDHFDETRVDAVLVDGPVPGSGLEHSWSRFSQRTWTRPVIVAGGMTAATVGEVLAVTGAWGCDVASGVESTPGVKDSTLVRAFVRAASRYFEQREGEHG
ncbi:MAG TPA: phosphoribosylanthranilate isomerase [Acidimicrobiales bacterium]|nr:phosphoribosylanthranilate isomerase [Acidimicrobiales bacterium]